MSERSAALPNTGRCGSPRSRSSRCRSSCARSACRVNTASMVVILAIAAHGAQPAASATPAWCRSVTARGSASAPMPPALIQLHWFRRRRSGCRFCCRWSLVAVLSTVVGILILRRRGVYFSLLTLALAALTYTIAFRWTEVTGGEDGLGGLKRGSIGPFNLDDALAYYIVVALIALGVLYRAAARGALAVRACAGGDPREPVARHVPGLSGRALQARRSSCSRRW